MSENQIDTMLDNLKVAKGEKEALELAESEVDRLFDEHAVVADNADRDNIHVGVARWKGRNGVCKYKRRLDKKRHGERMSSLPRATGDHTIVINERIFEQGNRDEFIDTIRHELAHAIAYEKHGSNQKHNCNWRAIASQLGADPSSCHNKRDRSDEFEYYIGCPKCGMTAGKTKRSKVIKQPFNRMCGKCGAHDLSSFDAGGKPPSEHGVVAVESLEWDNKQEWIEAGKP